ncbi:MAG: ACP S-malonyltransferase, partial [Phycisphaerae bacterium]
MCSSELALVFPGQGAHDVHMLERAADCPGFAERYGLICDLLGRSPLDEWRRGNTDSVNLNRVSSLLTVLVSSLYLDAFRERHGRSDAPLAGYSVGQWTALYAAGCISFARLAEIVHRRALMMDACFDNDAGAMLAVIGLAEDRVEQCCAEIRSGGLFAAISNHNCAGQFSVAGTRAAMDRLERRFEQLDAKIIVRLPVSGAWHCALLESAAAALGDYLGDVSFTAARVPVVDN